MNGYDFYCTYQAIRLHFTTPNYNFFQYDGKTKVSVDAFQKRRDKFLFHRLARKYSEIEVVPFLVANFVHRDEQWARNLLEDEAEDVYEKWKQTKESLEQIYAEELKKVAVSKETFGELFKVKSNQFPKLLMLHMQKQVSIEVMVILNSMLQYLDKWDKEIKDDIIYPKIAMKIRKYAAFLPVDSSKYKSLTKKVLLGDGNDI